MSNIAWYITRVEELFLPRYRTDFIYFLKTTEIKVEWQDLDLANVL